MIEINKKEIHEYILKLIDDGLGSELTSLELAEILLLWEKQKILSCKNCNLDVMKTIEILTNKIIQYKVDNDYILNSVSWELKNAEQIKNTVAHEEFIEYEFNDSLKFFLENLLKRKG